MSENVKIQIQEYDKTTPGGSGMDSTDIVFIPGFSINLNAPTSPTLVTTVYEFEKYFGKRPYILTTNDVSETYEKYGFKAGDPDRSYVYAKELLYQGLPVVYYVVPRANSIIVHSPKSADIALKSHVASKYTASVNSGVVTLTGKYDESAPETEDNVFSGGLTISNIEFIIPSKSNGALMVDLEASCTSTNTSDMFSIHHVTLEPNDPPKNLNLTIDNNIIYYDNSGEQDATLSVKLIILCEFTMLYTDAHKTDNVVTLKLSKTNTKNTTSVLESFYGEKNVINDVWSTPTEDNIPENSIADKSIYSIKYITSGGYPSVISQSTTSAKSMFASEMLSAAEHRGDAVALIDYQLAPDEKVYGDNSVYSKLSKAFVGNSFGAAMYPWGMYNCSSTLNGPDDNPVIAMPPSFAYMMCLAKAIKTGPNWLAMAGVTRGVVPKLEKLLVPNNVISNIIAEEMQPKFGKEGNYLSLNTITNIRPYGLTLWGNRTLKDMSTEGAVALNFLNTRNMLSDIKKVLYTTAKSCMFEQDSDDLWLKFKDGIRPLLDKLKAGNGLSDYKIIRGTTKYDGNPIQKGEIAAVIKVYPMYAVEYFELAVEINDQEVTVE